MEIDIPKLKATRAMPDKAFFLGKRIVRRVYPGKNITNGIPNIARKTLLGKTVMVITNSNARILIMKSSVIGLMRMKI